MQWAPFQRNTMKNGEVHAVIPKICEVWCYFIGQYHTKTGIH